MSKYKVGDKVLLEVVITRINEKCQIPIEVEFKDRSRGSFEEEHLLDASKTYEKGLADAWELARKINDMPNSKMQEIFDISEDVIEVEWELFNNFTPQQALAKIEKYEESKEQLKRFDVVESPSGNLYYVSHIEDNKNGTPIIYHYVGLDKGFTLTSSAKFKKTGKHLDIEHLLEQIRGDE